MNGEKSNSCNTQKQILYQHMYIRCSLSLPMVSGVWCSWLQGRRTVKVTGETLRWHLLQITVWSFVVLERKCDTSEMMTVACAPSQQSSGIDSAMCWANDFRMMVVLILWGECGTPSCSERIVRSWCRKGSKLWSSLQGNGFHRSDILLPLPRSDASDSKPYKDL